ncbi:class D sortase [Candidatus Roizmanbacteria bacterium]|nr:class D sortase [Candidatus Roizmanbacteria bacterium]
MSLYRYVKQNNSSSRKAFHYASYLSLTAGAFLLFWSLYPIISFEIYSKLFIERSFRSPVPRSSLASSLEKAGAVLGNYNVFSNNLRDFTQASLWFPSVKQPQSVGDFKIKSYVLSIPKLGIKEAKVVVGGEDLAKSLVQFLPRSLPGEYGNMVIFGHSSLPQLYNGHDYRTLFTYLPSLNKGDEIGVTVGDTTYRYEVYDMFVVKPDQVSVLEQQTDAAYLTLITCVPPGTLWNRLVVKARLTKIPSF